MIGMKMPLIERLLKVYFSRIGNLVELKSPRMFSSPLQVLNLYAFLSQRVLMPGTPVTTLILLLIQSSTGVVASDDSDDINIHFYLEPNPRPGWFKDSTELRV